MSTDSTPRDGPIARLSPTPPVPDAHGQAALLLAEATLHALVEIRAMSAGQALAVVRTASEVKAELAEASNEPDDQLRKAINLLSRIERTFQADARERADGIVAANEAF